MSFNYTYQGSTLTYSNSGGGACALIGTVSINPNRIITIPDTAYDSGNNSYNVTSLSDNSINDSNSNRCTSVIIPSSVTQIGNSAFLGDSYLQNITVDSNNLFFSSINGLLFDKTGTILLKCPSNYNVTNVSSIIIFNLPTMTTIASGAFDNFYSQPPYINGINFSSCTNLTTINGLGNFSNQVYASIMNIVLPSSVTTIGDYGMSRLINVNVNFNDLTSLTYLGNNAFEYGVFLRGNFVFCSSLTFLGTRLFFRASNSNLSINLSACTLLTTIPFQSFTLNSRQIYQNIILPNTITTIENLAFSDAEINNINIPPSVTLIKSNAFTQTTLWQNIYFYGLTLPTIQVEAFTIGYTTNCVCWYQFGVDITPLRPYFTKFAAMNVPCFAEGSKIFTMQGYKPIEKLRKGELIKTLKHGFVPIFAIGKREMQHSCLEERIKDQLYKCSNSQYPELSEDLIITGCHAILVDDLKENQEIETREIFNGRLFSTDDKYRLPACVDDRTTVYDIPGTYTIYHLALEHDDYYMNYGIYANGLLVESCSKRYLLELSNMTLIE